MSYTSLAFAFFVVLCLLVYYAVPQKMRYIVLLVFSYAFYIITCKWYVVYIIVTTISTYFAGLYVGRVDEKLKDYLKLNKETISKDEKKSLKAAAKKQQKRCMVAALLLNFGILAVIKYADFVLANLNYIKLTVFHSTHFFSFLNLVLPLGISFYIFQSMGYVIDIFYGKYKAERNFAKMALYVSFFPQIVQGPISRFNELSVTLFEGHKLDFKNISYGMYQILWGLFKKLVIADTVASFVSNTVEAYETTGGTYLLLAIFMYSMEIYGDFSGGIDITIGVARLFGVEITANFYRPFFSKNVAEYWRRWHITLGTWFKDYIFYPLTVSKKIMNLGKWIRTHVNDGLGKRIPIYLSMFFVWAATGLWHGSQWRYIVWGLLNFVILTFSTEAEPLYKRINEVLHLENTFLLKFIRVVRTFWIMSFLRVFDVAEGGIGQALSIIKKALTNICMPDVAVLGELGLPLQELKIVIVAIIILFAFELLQRKGSIRDRLYKMPTIGRWALTGLLLSVILIYGSYGIGYDSRAFIYLQF